MKKNSLLAILIAFLFVSVSDAQTTVYRDSTGHDSVDIYAGVLSAVNYQTNDGKVVIGPSYRFGMRAVKQLNNRFSLVGFLVGEIDGPNYLDNYSHLYIKYVDGNKKFTAIVGQSATPATEIRPIPISGAGHFEPVATTFAPGAEPLVKLAYKIGKVRIVGSAGYKAKELDLQAGIGYKKFRIVGYHRESLYGAMAEIKFDSKDTSVSIYQVAIYDNSQVLGGNTSIDFKKLGFSLYGDYRIPIYGKANDIKFGVWPRNEFGICHGFEFKSWAPMKFYSGLFGIGWDNSRQWVRAYIHVFTGRW